MMLGIHCGQQHRNVRRLIYSRSGCSPESSRKPLLVGLAGTCSWEPFVRQTIEMLRDHEHDYELGPGYTQHADGTICERYWERKRPPRATPPASPAAVPNMATCTASPPGSPENPLLPDQRGDAGEGGDRARSRSSSSVSSASSASGSSTSSSKRHPKPCPCDEKLPYTIELVGVTCDPTLAVARGFWRRLRSGRGVAVAAQLRSHRLFSDNWTKICKMMDSATLYHTGAHPSRKPDAS